VPSDPLVHNGTLMAAAPGLWLFPSTANPQMAIGRLKSIGLTKWSRSLPPEPEPASRVGPIGWLMRPVWFWRRSPQVVG